MKTIELILFFALAVGGLSTTGHAQRMLGVTPSDGEVMLLKAFTVPTGTEILGAQFTNNDPNTVFPEVILFGGKLSSLVSGDVFASISNIQEDAGGVAKALWEQPIQVTTEELFYVGIRFPAGPGKLGLGTGAAIGATDVSAPNGSFLASGPDPLVPIVADLSITLLTQGVGKAAFSSQQPMHPQSDSQGTFTTSLFGGSPNPAHPSTAIRFSLAKPMHVRMNVYDVTGRLVRSLLDETLSSGVHQCTWDGRNNRGILASSGTYFTKLRTGEGVFTNKIVLAR